MAQSSANIIDQVLPPGVPLRQWVLTCPFELRARLGFDAPLLGQLSAAVNGCLLDFYERALRPRSAPLPSLDGQPGRRPKLHSGTITVVQRVSSDLRLNPQIVTLVLTALIALIVAGFDIDLRCPRCHNTMKLKSLLSSGESLQRLLSRLGEPTDVQAKAPARGPPYFASRVLRHRFAQPTTQLDILD
jgi:hypothetical protein